jgi:hypothetical protein
MSGTGIRYNPNTDHCSVFGGSLYCVVQSIKVEKLKNFDVKLFNTRSCLAGEKKVNSQIQMLEENW